MLYRCWIWWSLQGQSQYALVFQRKVQCSRSLVEMLVLAAAEFIMRESLIEQTQLATTPKLFHLKLSVQTTRSLPQHEAAAEGSRDFQLLFLILSQSKPPISDSQYQPGTVSCSHSSQQSTEVVSVCHCTWTKMLAMYFQCKSTWIKSNKVQKNKSN